MDNNEIKKIFKELNIDLSDINSASNSFNSNVFIVKSNEGKKYVLKFCNNEKKMYNESKYMKYLKKYIPVSDVISTGMYKERFYIIQSFFDGKNIYDEEAKNLTDEEIRNIGILLAKLHTCPLLDEDNNYWVEYLKGCVDKTEFTLEKLFGKENNNIIVNFLRKCIDNEIQLDFKNSILHMDFRFGNLIFNNDIGLIDLESMKNGDYVFDFVKINRLLPKKRFKIILDGYNSIKKLDKNFNKKLSFYSLFDSYTSLWWCVSKNQTESNFYKLNYKIVKKCLEKLIKTGEL